MQVNVLGQVDYLPTFEAMQAYTGSRTAESPDLLWICEHPAAYTQGLAGKSDHILDPGDIPVVQTNRGGQVTYHGPGQVVAYPLIDLKRAGYFVKEYVYRHRRGRHPHPDALRRHRAPGARRAGHLRAPGRPGQPRAALPGRVHIATIRNLTRHFWIWARSPRWASRSAGNCTYHGVALNVAMDLEPFSRINPCGYAGLQTVDLSTIGVSADWSEAADVF